MRVSLPAALLLAACPSAPLEPEPDRTSTYHYAADWRTEAQARRTIAEFERRAAAAVDPILVWIEALDFEHFIVVHAAIAWLAGCKDERAIEPLKRAEAKWAPRRIMGRGCDGGDWFSPNAMRAAEALAVLQADIAWAREVDPEPTVERKLDKALVLNRTQPNGALWKHLRPLLMASDSERVIPLLIHDDGEDVMKKLASFGARLTRYLVDAIRRPHDYYSRISAIRKAGALQIPETVEPMVTLLMELSSEDYNDEQSNYRRNLASALARFGDEILDDVERCLGRTTNARTCESLIEIAGEVGSSKALAFLKVHRGQYPECDKYIKRLEDR